MVNSNTNGSKKLLLIDLDDTLADIVDLKKDIFNSLKDLGIRDSEVIYERIKRNVSGDNWLMFFAGELESESGVKRDLIYGTLLEAVSRLKPNPKMLAYLKEFNGTKILYTFGNRKFQLQKIHALGLQEALDSIIIFTEGTPESKVEALKKYLHLDKKSLKIKGQNYQDVTFVDNSQDLLDMVNREYPWIKTVKAN